MKDASVKKIIQKMQPDEINTFLWDDNSVLHRHSDWEFTSTIDGTGTNIVNGTDYPLMPGDFVLLGPQHVHRFVSDSADIRRRDVCIADEKFQKLCSVLSPSLYDALCRHEKPIVVHLSIETFGELHKRLCKLNAFNSDDDHVGAVLASVVIYLLGIYLEHRSEKQLPESILSFLQQISTPDVFSLRINDIIALSSYSHSHFIKIFKKYVGKTIIEYVTDLRIAYAATLLSSTNQSVITIASKVGYDNQSFFAQKFKDKYNISPMEYRNSVHNTEAQPATGGGEHRQINRQTTQQ